MLGQPLKLSHPRSVLKESLVGSLQIRPASRFDLVFVDANKALTAAVHSVPIKDTATLQLGGPPMRVLVGGTPPLPNLRILPW